MKKFLILTVLLLFIGLILWKVSEKVSASKKSSAPRRGRGNVPVAVEVKPVIKDDIQDIGLFSGTLFPQSQFNVAPKVGGKLEQLLVNIGDHIKHDQLIAVLDSGEYLQQVEQAKADLQENKANIEESRSAMRIAQREYDRIKSLRKQNITSIASLDTAEAKLKNQTGKCKVFLSQSEKKKALLKASEVRLSYTRIHASWKGKKETRVVGERFVDEGAMLAPNTPIVSILDINSLIAVIHVIERDYPKIRKGQDAMIQTDAFPNENFSGKIIRIAPLLKETSRQARVEIEIPNENYALKPGMFVRVQLEFEKHENATLVPFTALIKWHDKEGVFIIDSEEMKARFVPVESGLINKQWVEILSPDTLTGSVVTLGQHLLRDGSSVLFPGATSARRLQRGTASGKAGTNQTPLSGKKP